MRDWVRPFKPLNGTGVTGNNLQQPNKVSDDFYNNTLEGWFNAAAFRSPTSTRERSAGSRRRPARRASMQFGIKYDF
jgi:hypothetical protein